MDQEQVRMFNFITYSANNSIPLITRGDRRSQPGGDAPIESREGVFYSFPLRNLWRMPLREELYDLGRIQGEIRSGGAVRECSQEK